VISENSLFGGAPLDSAYLFNKRALLGIVGLLRKDAANPVWRTA